MLFKEGRPGTGENWAEKIACELAELIGLPHANYEFASYEGRAGVVSGTIVARSARLIHGNELLANVVTGYDAHHAKPYHRQEHTLRRVIGYFRGGSELVGAPQTFAQTDRISSALDVFVGYLMFDAWIANQDRHDENWGVLRTVEGNSFLAPSYDHGSSMGRNEPDAKREVMLRTRDRGQHISRYVTLARSALFPHSVGERPKALTTLEAFSLASRHGYDAALEWRERLQAVDRNAVARIIDGVPGQLMTDIAREFTLQLLWLNRERVLDCEI